MGKTKHKLPCWCPVVWCRQEPLLLLPMLHAAETRGQHVFLLKLLTAISKEINILGIHTLHANSCTILWIIQIWRKANWGHNYKKIIALCSRSLLTWSSSQMNMELQISLLVNKCNGETKYSNGILNTPKSYVITKSCIILWSIKMSIFFKTIWIWATTSIYTKHKRKTKAWHKY